MIEIELQSTARGFYKFEARKPDGSRRLVADWFPNLITDAGLNVMGDSDDWLSACQVGTGNTAPANGDTALVAYLVGTSTVPTTNTSSSQASPPYYTERTKVYRFAEGVAAGNLAEVGIGSTTTTGNLFSRALILDGGGSPTTITILSDETLDVTYQIRVYPPTGDITGTVALGGITYDYTGRSASVTSNSSSAGWYIGSGGTNADNSASIFTSAKNGVIGDITTTPAGAGDFSTSITPDAYSASSLERGFVAVWGLDDGNLSGGVRSIISKMGIGIFQVEFSSQIDSTAIPKDATNILSISIKHSWARGSI